MRTRHQAWHYTINVRKEGAEAKKEGAFADFKKKCKIDDCRPSVEGQGGSRSADGSPKGEAEVIRMEENEEEKTRRKLDNEISREEKAAGGTEDKPAGNTSRRGRKEEGKLTGSR